LSSTVAIKGFVALLWAKNAFAKEDTHDIVMTLTDAKRETRTRNLSENHARGMVQKLPERERERERDQPEDLKEKP
jgi:hypothetical protein